MTKRHDAQPLMESNLFAAGRVNRAFDKQFQRIGSTLTIRKPPQFEVASLEAA